jgi:hypothetical protein
MHGKKRNADRILMGKPEGTLGRPRCKWEYNIKIDLREIGWGCCVLDCPGSGLGQVAGSCEHGNEPSGSI